MGDTIRIPLTQGKEALIDAADAHLAAHRWCASRGYGTFYAVRGVPDGRGGQTQQALHRVVMNVGPGVAADHINSDGLDCRRSNLRVASKAQNAQNERRRKTNSSGFKGVHWHAAKHKWHARITYDRRMRHLGYFSTAEEAGAAYDAAARQHFGEFARTNAALRGGG